MYIVNNQTYHCAVSITNDIFNDKWKFSIIWHLLDGEKRYKELQEEVCQITKKTLTSKLKELEEKGLIKREAFAEVPLRVVYSLTPIGMELKAILQEMELWAIKYTKEKGEITPENNCSLKN